MNKRTILVAGIGTTPVDPANAFLTRKDAAHLWCVACSRAREKLVIVGNKAKMAVSPFAAKLMNIKNG